MTYKEYSQIEELMNNISAYNKIISLFSNDYNFSEMPIFVLREHSIDAPGLETHNEITVPDECYKAIINVIRSYYESAHKDFDSLKITYGTDDTLKPKE